MLNYQDRLSVLVIILLMSIVIVMDFVIMIQMVITYVMDKMIYQIVFMVG